jgi:hypothetical protein
MATWIKASWPGLARLLNDIAETGSYDDPIPSVKVRAADSNTVSVVIPRRVSRKLDRKSLQEKYS